jgi:hypothetical protein
MAKIDINEFATYGLMAQSLDAYFNNAGDQSYTPPGGFHQNYHMKTKKKKYNKDTVPNAWADPNSTLQFNAQGSGAKGVINDFLNKDENTLKYFWQWAHQYGGDQPTNTETSNPAIIQMSPWNGGNAIPQFKYTSNKFDWINWYDQINMWSSGDKNIDSSNVQQLALDQTDNLEVTGITYGNYTEDYNSEPSSTGQSSSDFSTSVTFTAIVNKEEEINVAGAYESSITNTASTTTETSTTDTQEFGLGVDVSYEQQTGIPDVSQTTVQYGLSANYDQSWSQTDTFSYSEETSTTDTEGGSISYSSTITPTAADDTDAVSIDVDGSKYIIEGGDNVTINTTFSKGIYYANLSAPYLLDGTVGNFTLATLSQIGDALYTDAFTSQSTPVAGPQTIASNIGNAAKWATEYDWQSPFKVSSDTVIEQYSKDDSQAYVENASTATTGAGAYFIINTYINGVLIEGSARTARKSGKDQRFPQEVSNRLNLLGFDVPSGFDDYKVHDLQQLSLDKIERLQLSPDQAQKLPGYYIDQSTNRNSIVVLPDKTNYVDLSDSRARNLIVSEKGGGIIKTGKKNDIVMTNSGSTQTITTGKGSDTIYSLGDGDNVNSGSGSDKVYALGSHAFIDLGMGDNESVLLGDSTRINLFNFKPGSSRLGKSKLSNTNDRVDNFSKNNFKLSETLSNDEFAIENADGNKIGYLTLRDNHGASAGSLWIDYAMKLKNGTLMDSLSNNRDELTLSKKDVTRTSLGSYLGSVIRDDLESLALDGKEDFMKKGFARGKNRYQLNYNQAIGEQISDSLIDWFSSTATQIVEKYQKRGSSVDVEKFGNIRSIISPIVEKMAGDRHGQYWNDGKSAVGFIQGVTTEIVSEINNMMV